MIYHKFKNFPKWTFLFWSMPMRITLIRKHFFGKTFTIHAGNTELQRQLENRSGVREIENSWKKDLESFKTIRKKYLIYK